MTTLAVLKARVATELVRTDQTAAIAAAITRAIEHYADTPFWFNHGSGSTVTVSGTDTAALPTGLRVEDPDGVFLERSGYGERLRKRSLAEIEDFHQVVTTDNQPTDYCRIGALLRLYPTPDDAYTVRVIGVYDQPALSSDSSTNAWTNEAQDLIAARAKHLVARDILQDPEKAAAALTAETEALRDLKRKTARRLGTGRIRASE